MFQAARVPVAAILNLTEGWLIGASPLVILALVFLLSWQFANIRVAIGAIAGLFFLGLIGIWDQTMITLSLVITAVFFSTAVGIPIGIWSSRNRRVASVIRPILDIMQTLPGFVYLVPIVMLVGIGKVPGVMVTVVFALPPVVRLTDLGIRQVPNSTIEAASAFGSSPWQILTKIQLPLALPTVLMGINQTLMMALSMVVIASMIGVGGLGNVVLQGIGRLDMGLATVGGVGIVVLAMILDRITQAIGRVGKQDPLLLRGPIGLLFRIAPNVQHHIKHKTTAG